MKAGTQTGAGPGFAGFAVCVGPLRGFGLCNLVDVNVVSPLNGLCRSAFFLDVSKNAKTFQKLLKSFWLRFFWDIDFEIACVALGNGLPRLVF